MHAIASVHHGIILETSLVPSGFLRRLEAEGVAAMTARTVEGVYLEPRVQLRDLLARFELAGVAVRGLREARGPAVWRHVTRTGTECGQRLRSPRAAEWLPTLPAA